MEQQRRRVLYSGHVQGVGFRFNATRKAQPFAVTGYVRNLADGRVELVAEGDPGELDGLLAAIASSMEGFIQDASVESLAASGEFDEFGIRH